MGWMADKHEEADARMVAAVTPSVPAGETLRGVALATRVSTFSNKVYALAVTDAHLLLQPLDRRLAPSAPAALLRPDEIEVGNIFTEGASILSSKDEEIRFSGRGEKYRFMVLGGRMLENALASDGQLGGLGALVEFLRAAKR